jgi:hypothetical protein
MGRWQILSWLQMSLLDNKILINNFLLFESKISLQLMENLKTIFDIVKENIRWRCCHRTNMNWWNQIICM